MLFKAKINRGNINVANSEEKNDQCWFINMEVVSIFG